VVSRSVGSNWAGNVVYGARTLARPTDLDELRAVVAGAERVRALGTGHSFSTVADAPDVLVSLADLPRVLSIDAEARTVTVSAGTRWGELAPAVHRAGFAVHNLGSLPHISVAGSVATGTHGSGNGLGCLATAVSGLDVVTASGDRRRISRTDPDFLGSVVALGALGIVTAVTLDLQPTFDIRQTVFEGLPWAAALEGFDAVMGAAESVSLFTTWRGLGFEQVWVKERIGDASANLTWTTARPADGPRHPVPGASPVHCTEQGGVAGPWYERLPHFRLDFTPSSGDELQTEYLLDRADAVPALTALDSIRDRIADVLQISEIRTVAADELWLSPAYGRDSVAVHFTWIADADRVAPVVSAVERALEPFGPRPHWGKVFSVSTADVVSSYERMPDMRDLVSRQDPDGVFGNDFVDPFLRPSTGTGRVTR
jgi:xylitol oxidase